MDIVYFSKFLLYLAIFQICKGHETEDDTEEENIGGIPLAVAGTNPYQVAILQRLNFNFDVIDGKKFVGSGSLIGPKWVLTAAQCVSNTNLRIILGVNNIRVYEPQQRAYDITHKNIFVHPKYDTETLENNIALIQLPEETEYNNYIQPIEYGLNGDSHVNETVFISGWGRISPFTPIADLLRQTTTKVISNDKCQRKLTDPFFYISCTHLCTNGGLIFSEIGACSGDTGAPLIAFNTERARPEQIGIVSKPPFVCRGKEPTIYTKVNSYRDWIGKVMSGHDKGNGDGDCAGT